MLANEPTDPIDSTERSDHSDSTELRRPDRPATLHVASVFADGTRRPPVSYPWRVMRTYEVRTYGCQMNVHDSERLSGLLEEAGYVAAPDGRGRRRGGLQHLRGAGERRQQALRQPRSPGAGEGASGPGMQIAVGGCLAQKDRATITKKAPWVDVVFGTHNIGSLPALLERARANDEAQVEILESLEVFPSTLPTKRESAYAAWVSVLGRLQQHLHVLHRPGAARQGEGPPARRDPRPRSRRWWPRASARSRCSARTSTRTAWSSATGRRSASCCAPAAEIEGLERVRFTSPHPAEFTDDVIEAMAETPNVMPSLHMPLQSGSDRVLKAMRRSYRQEKYLGIIDRVRAAIPDAAITTDIIVGFPGETEEDFQATLDVVRAGAVRRRLHLPVLQAPRHAGRRRSPTRSTPAVVKDRYQRLVAVADEVAWAENKRQVGRRLEVMVAEGEGRKDAATHRLSGRAPDNRLVHFTAPDVEVRPGDVATVEITYAAPHHLVADGPVAVRRTRVRRRVGGAHAGAGARRRRARHADRRRPRHRCRSSRLPLTCEAVTASHARPRVRRGVARTPRWRRDSCRADRDLRPGRVDRARGRRTSSRSARGRYALPGVDAARAAAHRLSRRGVAGARPPMHLRAGSCSVLPVGPRSRVRGVAGRSSTVAQRVGRRVHRGRPGLRPRSTDGVTTRTARWSTACGTCPMDEATGCGRLGAAARLLGRAALALLAASARGPRHRPQIRRVAGTRVRGRRQCRSSPALRAIALTVPGLRVGRRSRSTSRTSSGGPTWSTSGCGSSLEADSFEWHGRRAALRRDAQRYDDVRGPRLAGAAVRL